MILKNSPWALIGCLFALLALEGVAWAQPDTCTVSVLNQTAHVQADGTWSVPNVPANMGPVRARVTCLTNGVPSSGASPFFAITPDSTSAIETVALGTDVKTPVGLALTASRPILTASGETLQLQAVATFSEGSTADRTAADSGTIYTTTSPAVATVDANGLVTAQGSGKVLIGALHEAILATVELQVLLGGDSDGDGIPDDWEIAHGLNPNDEFDALEDPDHDGLSNLAEYQQGTDPLNPDTDGDGLSDGDEVNRYHTNPLVADTDGDGLRDGLEVRTGSDPLDPSSFNLAAALASVSATPSPLRIVFNTVLGEASRQLKVTGQLVDGTSLDLTSRRFGTSYSSSDLSIASFGAEDGRVYAGASGEATVTVSVGGHSAPVSVAVSTFSPHPLSFLPLPGFANGVAVSGSYAFVATGVTGLQVVDVSDLSSPRLVAAVDTPGNANDVRVVGSYAYVADGPAGLAVVDISNPLAPRLVGAESVVGRATDLVIVAGKAYVADESGLSLVDVSNPQHPRFLGAVATPGRARGVDVVDNLAVVAASSAGVFVIDVSDPQNPAIVGQTATRPDGTSNAADVTVRERLAYIADGAQAGLGGLRVIDFRDPTNPVVVASSGDAFGLTGVALDRGLAITSDYYFVNAAPIFGADLGLAQLRDLVDFSSFRDDAGQNLAVRDGVVFVAGTECCSSTHDNGTTGGSGLFIGRYAVAEEDDTTPPTVKLTAPLPGATVGERTFLPLRADAHDDGTVDSVQFRIDGATVFTDYTPPFEYLFAVPAGGGPTFTVEAVATDLAGNQASTAAVVIGVTPNQAPTVALLSPVAGRKAIVGTFLTIAAQATDDHAVTRVELRVNGTLVKTFAGPPYRFDYTVPSGLSSLAVTAVAYDDQGPSETAGPVTVAVGTDDPPSAQVLSPHDGFQAVEGAPLAVLAGVADDVGLRQVEFLVDGVRQATLTSPPYQWSTFAPANGVSQRLSVVAEDTLFHRTTSREVVVTGIADPLTAITGRTVDPSGAPLAGARVEAGGTLTLSASDGTFTLQGLPTASGDLALTASVFINGFAFQGRLDEPVHPAPGEVIEVGNVVLTPDDPGTTVTGSVVDESGLPLPGATVKIFDTDYLATTTARPDGSFTLAGAPSFGTLSVAAFATVGATQFRGLSAVSPGGESSADAGTIILSPVEESSDPPTSVAGRVVDESGAPIPSVRVYVFTSYDVFPALTAGDGTFTLATVPSTDGDLFASVSVSINGLPGRGVAFASPEPGGVTDFGSIVVRVGGGVKLLPPFVDPLLDLRLAMAGPSFGSPPRTPALACGGS